MPDDASLAFVPNREVRVVPAGWQHPRDARGRYVPVLPSGYVSDDGEHVDLMPEPTGATEIAAYETVSEGTPISPAFPDTTEGRLALVNYCAEHATTFGDHRAGAEAWAAILFGDASVGLDGTVRA
jgi:hypothetical protein